MKKSLIALAALASIAGVAQAQDGVSLYGRIDAGVAGVNATKTGQQLGNGAGFADSSMESSMWGIKGSEDLGQGLKAIFDLEGDLPAAGNLYASNVLFRRQSNVGLSSYQWGTIQLGTVYDSLAADAELSILPVAGNSVNFTSQLAGGTANYFPTQALKYTLPRMMNGMLTGGFTYSSGNLPNQYSITTTNPSTTTTYNANTTAGSLLDGYLRLEPMKDLKLTVGAGSLQADPGSYGSAITAYAPYYRSPYGGHEYLAGASYKYGRYSIGAIFTVSNAAAALTPALPTGSSMDIRTSSLGLGYQATDRVKLGLNYVHNTGNTNMYNIQAHYAFTKRTEVYAQYAYVSEGSYGQMSPIWWGDNQGSTAVANADIGANTTAQALMVGMIHRF